MRGIYRVTAVVLATTVPLVGPASATVQIHVQSGVFDQKKVSIPSGETVEWVFDDPAAAIAGVSGAVLDPVTGELVAGFDPTRVCSASRLLPPGGATPAFHLDPAYVGPYGRAFAGADPGELTGPERHGVSGIWALGPEGGSVSDLEIPSLEASALVPGIAVNTSPGVDSCDALDRDYPYPAFGYILRYDYTRHDVASGLGPARAAVLGETDPAEVWLKQQVTDPAGVDHVLCRARTSIIDPAGQETNVLPDPARPWSIPPGTYMNGLLQSTYDNPDVTGVVLRFNWKDLQYDDGGMIRERWDVLDRELERAIAARKLVTLDVRAGQFGTPDWIFADYLTPGSPYAAPWCVPGSCNPMVGNPMAGHVAALEFRDHYDEDPPGTGCGDLMRIGAPGDPAYRELYSDFMRKLAEHVAEDTRRFQAIAHVKVSGANLRTSEAELPHHCNDLYDNTADHHPDVKATYANPDPVNKLHADGVLDVFKTLLPSGRRTESCTCNPQVWFDHGYYPEQLYDYYAQVESTIVAAFFGRKSLGYQLIQDGFPRARAPHLVGGVMLPGSFQGDHLYREALVPWTPLTSVPVSCGNGIVEAGEQCDDGNAIDDDGCRDCLICGNGVLDVGEACDDGNLLDGDGCESDCAAQVNLGFAWGASCPLPTVDALGFPHEEEDANVARYCSSDLDGSGQHDWLALLPLRPGASPLLSAFQGESAGDVRYPSAFRQSTTVMHEAGDGRFGDPAVPGYTDPVLGKLFVPQHSGIQPYPTERGQLYFARNASAPCNQEQPAVTAAAAGAPPEAGAFVAAFPIAAGTAATPYWDSAGCPNHWIVDQGTRTRNVGGIVRPPQVTGFQVVNAVRTPAHVESALMNLVHNTNGVFMELYEDAIWHIARSRGTGALALPIDDAARPARLEQDPTGAYTTCAPGYTCYSKNLAEWSAELHWRREGAEARWSSFNGVDYPTMRYPFPALHAVTFTNTTGAVVRYPYIDPGRCEALAVDTGAMGVPGPSALGVIEVQP